jgi:parallel beta-helix repeat protein
VLKTVCLSALIYFISSGNAFATNYYVDTNHPAANDTSNPGTEELPFKTIQKGIDVALPGDSVFVKSGTYIQTDELVMKRSGVQDSLIVFKAIGNVLVQFPDSVQKGWRWSTLFNNYLVIEGFDLSGSDLPFFVQGSFNQILNCKVHDCNKDGINIAGGSHNIISRNNVYNTGWNAIYIESRPNSGDKGRADSNLVEYNSCNNNPNHFGINIFPNTNQVQDSLVGNIIRYNKIYNCLGGIYLRYSLNGEIYGNLIYNNANNGIYMHHRSIDDQPYPFPSNLKIYNNTFANNTPYYNINNSSFTDVDIKNNIFYQFTNLPPVRIQHTSGTILNNNLYFNPTTPFIIVWGDSSKKLEQMRSIGFELNGLQRNPLLSLDYKLTLQSPAIDAGADLGSPYNLDMVGNQRGQGAGWDIGAFEDYNNSICKLNIKLFLEGPYDNGSMRTDLLTFNLIPIKNPYESSPWNYIGNDSVANIPANIVDWVLIELRTNETEKRYVRTAFLKNDGHLVDLDGLSLVNLNNINEGKYFVVIHHRNHLSVMSSTTIDISEFSELYDFTTGDSQAFGTNAMGNLGAGIFGLYAGDTNKSGIITAADKSGINSNLNIQNYLYSDTNLSGIVDQDDKIPVISNNLKRDYVP